jgi:hypothetical protein
LAIWQICHALLCGDGRQAAAFGQELRGDPWIESRERAARTRRRRAEFVRLIRDGEDAKPVNG